MVNVQDLYFSYQQSNFHLRVPALEVAQGEKVAIIGPSGTGKTTLLNLVAGIIVPELGRINVAGVDLTDLNDPERRNFRISTIGFVFQDFALLEYLTVLDNILHPFRISRHLKVTNQIRKRALELSKELGIANRIESYPANLSQGEQQRGAICRALLNKPGLILADEATGNLDPVNKIRILNTLLESVDTHQASLLAVTHDNELLQYFDKVVDFRSFLQGETHV